LYYRARVDRISSGNRGASLQKHDEGAALARTRPLAVSPLAAGGILSKGEIEPSCPHEEPFRPLCVVNLAHAVENQSTRRPEDQEITGLQPHALLPRKACGITAVDRLAVGLGLTVQTVPMQCNAVRAQCDCRGGLGGCLFGGDWGVGEVTRVADGKGYDWKACREGGRGPASQPYRVILS